MSHASVVLAQLNPSATTLTDVYTVPAGRRASVNVLVSTQATSLVTVRLRKSGDSDSNKNFLSYNLSVDANKTQGIPASGTIILMSEGDTIAVYTDVSTLAVTVNGYEDEIPT